jgi:glycine/D-amino acid oxidase-like deaminating enzyme/nitrite reductase/ring-hydroxylating ferredoxin subunit
MDTTSVWRGTAPQTGFAMLDGDVARDVLVVGGGITGVTLAWLLAREGRSVVLLEALELGGGTTGNSTGNLYETLSRGLHEVRSRWDADVARLVAEQRRQAVDWVESVAGHACGFRRCDLYLYGMNEAERALAAQEFAALQEAGCPVRHEYAVPAPLPQPVREAVVLGRQAQFHPQAYVAHMAREAAQAGASIHEHSRVLELDMGKRRAVTATGSVQAGEVVLATHSPKGIRPVHAEMPVHREYAIAMPLAGADPGPGIFWARGTNHYSIRTVEGAGGKFLVVAGQEHKTGDHNSVAALRVVEEAARGQFGGAEIAFRWSAQNYRGADSLPYIGRDLGGAFIATGFATDGLTWGTVAAHVIARQIAGQSPAFGELCRPGRLTPAKSVTTVMEEVGTMAAALVKDYLTSSQAEELSTLEPGDSAILKVDGESFATYRSPEGELFAVSPICTHMGCKVHWNAVETSWDCPCHGSRFSPDGAVVEGPAVAPLKRKYVNLG